jgi:Ca2+-binding RTX toxin-like protein
VVALDTGGFAIAYEDNSGGEGDIEISFARFGSGGAFVDSHNVFSNENDDTAPTTARLANGLIAVGALNDSPLGGGSGIAILDETGAMRTALTGHSEGNNSFVGVAGLSLGRVAQLYTDVETNEVAARVFNVVRSQASDDQGDRMVGTEFIDQLSAGGGDDVLRGGLNADILNGGSGNDAFEYDTFEVGAGEVIDGGAGTDRIHAFSTISLLRASLVSIERIDFAFDVAQRIEISVLAEDFGNGLAADLRVGFGDPVLGHTLRVLMAEDTSLNLSRLQLGFFDPEDFLDSRLIEVHGDGDAERITGTAIRDHISGAGGNDILAGGGAPDILRGGGGNDFYTVDHQGEAIELAGQGTDTVRSDVAYTLGDNIERLQLTGAAGVTGRGNTLANILVGNDGANTLNGGGGRDTLTGGGGGDRFLFTNRLDPAANVDRVTDFAAGVDDLRLDDAVFAGLAPGALAADAFRIGTRAIDASDRIVYNPETGALFFDADGTGGAAQIRFATLAPGIALTAADFLVF